jgi:outer membrane protein assembly factor BamB
MMPRSLHIPGLCLLMLASIARAEDWPQFRGPTGQGISTAVDVPVEWSATKNIAWKIDVAGQGWSSPVLADGRIYLTTAIGAGTASVSLRVLCIDAHDGKTIWDVEAFKPDPAAVLVMHKKNSAASATPIIADGKLYVHFGPLGTAALDLSGKVLWRQTSLKFFPLHGNGGSPVLLGDELIFNCDGVGSPYVAALDARTGDVKWKTPRNTTAKMTFSFCTPLVIDVGGVTQVISPGSGFVGAYDPADGHELWRVKYGEGYSIVPRPVFSGGLLFLSSGFNTPILYAIKPEGAKGDATATNIAWTQRKGAPCTPSVLAAGDEIYAVSDNGLAVCADARTGKLHWSHQLSGGFSASPVLAEGRVYFQNEAGKGFVVKAEKQFSLVSENDLEERSLASYAVADHALFIRTEKHLWKIGGK